MQDKHIIVGITGGIAAYKSAILVRLLVKAGCEVQVIMTPNAREFIAPLTLSTLSGRPVITEFFTANTGQWNSHVDLGLWADAMVIAPATASTLGKMTSGVADNMLVTTYLSAKCPVFAAPAMDLDMWKHPSTQRNLRQLESDGVHIIEPAAGELASHLVGKGRMEEPEAIVRSLEAFFQKGKSLVGERILITAGPTYENIDPVRFIGNYSSGKMGFALAAECARRGAEVKLVSGPVSIMGAPQGCERIDVISAREMLAACESCFDWSTAAILCAAVADYAVANPCDKKIKREKRDEMDLHLVKNPDIAATLGARKGERKLVGFALETDSERDNALSKMKRKNLDWIVLNSLRDPEAGFGKDTNKVAILSASGQEIGFEAKAKSAVAVDIIDTVFGE